MTDRAPRIYYKSEHATVGDKVVVFQKSAYRMENVRSIHIEPVKTAEEFQDFLAYAGLAILLGGLAFTWNCLSKADWALSAIGIGIVLGGSALFWWALHLSLEPQASLRLKFMDGSSATPLLNIAHVELERLQGALAAAMAGYGDRDGIHAPIAIATLLSTATDEAMRVEVAEGEYIDPVSEKPGIPQLTGSG